MAKVRSMKLRVGIDRRPSNATLCVKLERVLCLLEAAESRRLAQIDVEEKQAIEQGRVLQECIQGAINRFAVERGASRPPEAGSCL